MTTLASSPLVRWFEKERGIRPETLDSWNVRFEGDDTVLLPYSDGEKTRVFLPDGKRKFFFTPGKTPPLYTNGQPISGAVFLVEGETDTLRLWQELRDEGRDNAVVGLSGINCWTSEMAASFSSATDVFVVLDNDIDYTVSARVDQVWMQIRRDLGSKARRLRLPNGIKDLCEFFQGFDLTALRALSERMGVRSSRYSPLDLMGPIPPVEWLVEGLIAKGDVTLLMGDSSLGKSWATMLLALRIAQGGEDYLGHAVMEHGRVLYVDEENPEDVVFDRLRRLGLTTPGASQIRYLHNQGIRLDRNPTEFLEEALDYNPSLIVMDSLTRIHTEDENSSGAMAKLYNDGIKPLARETEAAVVIIHHANKSQGSSIVRARGSTDIVASVDSAIDARPTEPYRDSFFQLRQFKSRRRKGGKGFDVEIRDVGDKAELVRHDQMEPPF